ncbi:hypothetical protein FB451DRAFT_1363611 [Mycena latifolia]|nr:hypothetical protein FB451DRAFT_1363611 [Mycena latifolia]
MSTDASVAQFLHVVNASQVWSTLSRIFAWAELLPDLHCLYTSRSYDAATILKENFSGTTSILIWDWLSCLPQEWRSIWKWEGGWSAIKVLYLVVRYYTLLVLVVTDVWFFATWSESSCARHVRILPGIAVFIDLAIESGEINPYPNTQLLNDLLVLVLAIRIYAIYGCDRKIGVFLVALIAGFLGVMIAVPILAFDYTRLPSWPGPCIGMRDVCRAGSIEIQPRVEVTGKPSIAGPKFIIAFYAAPVVIEENRTGGSSSLMNRVVRGGLLYFFAITSLNMLNVIFFIQKDKFIQALNASMSIQISSVLCCRLILNLRSQTDPRLIKKFSNTRGRWVTDVVNDMGPLDIIRFSMRSRDRNSPAIARDTESDSPITPQDGVIHFEQDVHDDNWKTCENGSLPDV